MVLLAGAVGLTACGDEPWNNPYPPEEAGQAVYYSSFEERPKHLDPAKSYSENEYVFLAQIYEPPLQYHFLQRPYALIPATATTVPQPRFYDANNQPLPADAAPSAVAMSVYEIRIQPGIRYQPHPALARDERGAYVYHQLTAEDLKHINTLGDFTQTGTREVTAEDYVYQIKRLAHPEVHSPIFSIMAEYIDGLREYGALLQAEKKRATRLDLTRYPLRGVEVVDRYTYRLKIKGKYPQLLYWLAMPFFAPMPPEAELFYNQAGMAKKNITLDWYPIGTGPFMLTVNNPNRQMVMVRNPNFHGERYPSSGEPGDEQAGLLKDAGKPLPFIDKAVFSLEKESIPYWNKFLQGYYDSSGVLNESFDKVVRIDTQGEAGLTEEMQAQGIKLSTAIKASTSYIGFNMRDAVVGGLNERARKLRQAIAIAFDYEEFIAVFMNGRGIPAQGPVPPGLFGYRDGQAGRNAYVYDWVDGRAKRKSLAEAKRLLAEAGYPNGVDEKTGVPLTLNFDTVNSGADDKTRLDWLRKQFAKLNVQLSIRGTDYNRFQEKMTKGNAQIFMWGWNADYPDPENFLFLLFGPNGKVQSGGENAANYNNPQFNVLFEQMKNMDNSPARQAIIDRMVEIARHDSPWLWGVHPKAFGLHHAWYHNAKPNLMANNTLKYIRLDPQLRAQKRREWNPPIVWPLWLILALFALGTAPAIAAYVRKEHRPVTRRRLEDDMP